MTLWSREKLKHYISTITVSMATKLGRMVTYLKGFLAIKSCNALIKWSCKVTCQTKIILSRLPVYLWSPDFVEWWHTLDTPNQKVILCFDHAVLEGHVTNRNHYIIYSQPESLRLQTWWVQPYKVASNFDNVVLHDYVTN